MSLQERSPNFSNQPSPENSARKRTVSERRIQANRRNALFSSGPKTARGKRAVARNAIKHGLLAREVVITAGDGKENLEDFHSLVEGLWEDYEPVGVVEESLVQTIATCWWRKARVFRAENGEIRRRLDSLAVDLALRNSDKGNLELALMEGDLGWFSEGNQADVKVSTEDRWSTIQRAQTNVRGHRPGRTYLIALLREAKSEIAREGYLSEKIRQKIFLAFCFWDYVFALTCSYAGPPEAKVKGQPSDSAENKQAGKKGSNIVALIDDRLEMIREFEGYALEREELKADAETRSYSVPSTDVADKLLRYEAHLDRQLYRAMDQLERLQRRRKGDNVPPPLNINLGRKN